MAYYNPFSTKSNEEIMAAFNKVFTPMGNVGGPALQEDWFDIQNPMYQTTGTANARTSMYDTISRKLLNELGVDIADQTARHNFAKNLITSVKGQTLLNAGVNNDLSGTGTQAEAMSKYGNDYLRTGHLAVNPYRDTAAALQRNRADALEAGEEGKPYRDFIDSFQMRDALQGQALSQVAGPYRSLLGSTFDQAEKNLAGEDPARGYYGTLKDNPYLSGGTAYGTLPPWKIRAENERQRLANEEAQRLEQQRLENERLQREADERQQQQQEQWALDDEARRQQQRLDHEARQRQQQLDDAIKEDQGAWNKHGPTGPTRNDSPGLVENSGGGLANPYSGIVETPAALSLTAPAPVAIAFEEAVGLPLTGWDAAYWKQKAAQIGVDAAVAMLKNTNVAKARAAYGGAPPPRLRSADDMENALAMYDYLANAGYAPSEGREQYAQNYLNVARQYWVDPVRR